MSTDQRRVPKTKGPDRSGLLDLKTVQGPVPVTTTGPPGGKLLVSTCGRRRLGRSWSRLRCGRGKGASTEPGTSLLVLDLSLVHYYNCTVDVPS